MKGKYYIDCFDSFDARFPVNSYGPTSWGKCISIAKKLKDISGIRKVTISPWEGKYNPETKSLERGNPTGWTRTHIIPTVSCMKSNDGTDYGLQILRFHGDSADGEWELANNPYAGVYLKPDEWQKVMVKLL